MKLTEKILGGIILIGVALSFMLIKGGDIILVLSTSLLALIYFAFGFALFNNIRLHNLFKKESYAGVNTWRIVGAVCAGITLCFTLIGCLFTIQHWPGSYVQLLFSMLLLGIVAVISAIKLSSKTPLYRSVLMRGAIIGIPAVFLLMMPRLFLTELKYRNHPAYLNALHNELEHPDSLELIKKTDIERNTANGFDEP